MTGRRRPCGIGEQPPRSPGEILAADSIEELMPDSDRRDAALASVLAAVEIRRLADRADAAGQKRLSIELHDIAREKEAKERDQ